MKQVLPMFLSPLAPPELAAAVPATSSVGLSSLW